MRAVAFVPLVLVLSCGETREPPAVPKSKANWESNRDGDGIPDDKDRCPTEPEDFDGFQDDDGCPDFDNDGDGVRDVDDACMNNAMGPRPDPRHHGCPASDERR
jgi:hypothetical protein